MTNAITTIAKTTARTMVALELELVLLTADIGALLIIASLDVVLDVVRAIVVVDVDVMLDVALD